ncbi:MAG: hypothetical protein HKM95_07995 [Inquilinus sp.]|nr:hypothetical protein [Inquilinus sp.]
MNDATVEFAGEAEAAPAEPTAAGWTGGLDADQAALVAAKGWQSPADVVASYRHAERHIGRDPAALLTVPGEDAGADEWERIYDRLGRPEDPDGYGFDEREGADPEDDAALAGLAHELGLNREQAATLRDRHYEGAARGSADRLSALKDGVAEAGRALREQWGAGFGERDRLAGEAARFIGLDAADLARSGLLAGDTGLRLMQGLASLGEMLAEDRVVGGGGGFPSAAAEALGELDRLKLDQGFMDAYFSRDHAGHRAAVDRMRRLAEAAWPEPR